MSQNNIEKVKCPVCHYDSPMTMWNYIDAADDTEVREHFLNEDIYAWECEVCGHQLNIPYSTVYADYRNRFLIFYYPFESEETFAPFLLDPIKDGFDIKGFTLRRVFGINNLREKIGILEAGFNDVAIERLKYFQKLDKDLDFLPNDEVYFLGMDNDPELCKANKCERGVIKFAILREGNVPRFKAFQMELYFDYLLAVENDPRMKIEGGCPTVDWNWIDKKLRENE